jgi:hypothetical protein
LWNDPNLDAIFVADTSVYQNYARRVYPTLGDQVVPRTIKKPLSLARATGTSAIGN